MNYELKLHSKQLEIANQILGSDTKYNLINASRQSGKDLRNDMLLYYDGYESNIGNAKIGDRIYGDDGELTTVVGVYPQGLKRQFKITLADKRQFICGLEHQHQIYYHPSKKQRVVDTQFLINNYKSNRGKPENCYILTSKPVKYSEKQHIIHPYILGVLIAEGGLTKAKPIFTTGDSDIADYIKTLIDYDITHSEKYRYYIKTGTVFKDEIIRLGLNVKSEYKHIPDEYIYDSIENRIELLRGLMDGDGTICKKGKMEYYTASDRLKDGFLKLVRSLGMKAYSRIKKTSFIYNGVKKKGLDCNRISLFTNDINPFHLKRKRDRFKSNPKFNHHWKTAIVNIKEVSPAESTCISVDNNSKCFLTNDYTITHNSVLSTALVVYYAINEIDKEIMIISPTHQQNKKFFNKIKNELKLLKIATHINSSDLDIYTISGNHIQFKSAEKYDNIRGESIDILFVDEFSYIRREAWQSAIRPITSARKNAKVILTSTPKGHNTFYDLCMLGQDTSNDKYSYYQMMYYDNPFYDISEVEDAKKTLPENIFRTEYLAEFIADGLVFRNLDKICIQSEFKDRGSNFFGGLDFGQVTDYTVLTILNEFGETVVLHRVNSKSFRDIQAEVLPLLDKYKPILYVESNNGTINAPLVEQLEQHYHNIYHFQTTNASKQDIVESLNLSIDEDAITLPSKKLDPNVFFELSIFEYTYSVKTRKVVYSAPNGLHDDIVISICLANKSYRENKDNTGAYIVQPEYNNRW